MLRRLYRWLFAIDDYSKVQWPTRDPRPDIHFDGPSTAELIRRLK